MSGMVPALAPQVKRCLGCNTLIAPEKVAREYRVKIHAAGGRCRSCYKNDERRRVVPEPDPVRYRDMSWLLGAICVGEDPECFFPLPSDHQTYEKAKQICSRCPVKEQCLADSLETLDVQYGIRGGLTADARRRLLQKLKGKAA